MAGTVRAVLRPGLLERAAACGLRSLFIGFETLNSGNLQAQNKYHNLGQNYDRAVSRLLSLTGDPIEMHGDDYRVIGRLRGAKS